jgi:hypothetical protein
VKFDHPILAARYAVVARRRMVTQEASKDEMLYLSGHFWLY